MTKLLQFWTDHGTKILGNITAILSGMLIIPDLVQPAHVKWVALVNLIFGVMTTKRGFTNSDQMEK